MRMTLPLTGTIKYYFDGGFIGDNDDPVRPVDKDLGNVSWHMVSIDIEAETMTIEVEPAEKKAVQIGTEIDPETQKEVPVYKYEDTTEQDKQKLLVDAKKIETDNTVEELYHMTGNHRLIKPEGVKDA